jgi:arylsulfatase A-like enzyme
MNTFKINRPLVLLTLILLFVTCNPSRQISKEVQLPNIVFFFVDDMGWQDTSVPFHKEITPLNLQYHTPNMEQLAQEGVKFTQAYAYAVCSPSRISLMTGMNAARHRVTNWTLRKNQSPDQPNEKIQAPDWNVNGLSAKPGQERSIYSETLPQLLRKAGYKTIHAGKAHFGAKGTSGEDPLNLGFDVNIGGHAAGGPGSYWAKYNFSADWRSPGNHIWDVPGLDKYHGSNIYLTEALTQEANAAINQAIAEKKPFYLYFSHYAIHAPWEKDERFYKKYTDAGLSEFDAVYASMLEGMDKSLGDIIANLKRLGIDQNTIIVFMSDNGAPKQAAPNLPLRGHKLTPYEGGTRVPMIVKWPGVTQAGTTIKDYLIVEDIFPTFLEIARLKREAKKSKDGISFVPLLTGKGNYPSDRSLYWHYPNTYDQPPYSSVRKGEWKLIYHHTDRKLELFNLSEDIGEQNNRLEVNKTKAKELAGLLTNYLIEVEAQMPLDKNSGQLVEYPIQSLLNSTVGDWELIWEDEFEIDGFLDTSKWNIIERNTADWGNYMSNHEDCHEINSGKLYLRGIINPDTNTDTDTAQFLTGGVSTKGKFAWQYGKIEIRAKLENATGAWPAMWMLADQPKYGAYPRNGEIDLMEHLNHESQIYQTVHSYYTLELKQKQNPPYYTTTQAKTEEYNIYGMEWFPDKLVFTLNGVETFTYPRIEGVDPSQWPFDQPFYLMIDMQLGGSWVGRVDPEELPVQMIIDWVRVYK